MPARSSSSCSPRWSSWPRGWGWHRCSGGDDESTTDTGGVDESPPGESSDDAEVEPTPSPAPADDPAPTGTPGDENTPGQVVIGQEENGDDIIVEIEVTKVCAITFHTPIDDSSLSHIVWKYNAPGLDEGTEVTLILADGTRVPTTVVDKVISIEQGISSYGSYAFPEVEWEEDELIISTITPDGAHVVDEGEGLPSETCLQ